MTIPEICDRLRVLAAHYALPELDDLADELRRRPAGSRAPATSTPMTPALAALIRAHSMSHPSKSQVQVARHFGVNPGRVSEALHGKRV
jgi:hypothetical protein